MLDQVKTPVPYIQNIPRERIRIANKDVTLQSGAWQDEGVFITILLGNPMVLEEAFRNAYDCGTESFKRIEIKLREVDSGENGILAAFYCRLTIKYMKK